MESFENSEYFKLFAEIATTAHQGGKAATELLLSQVPLSATSRILEIGCGSGQSLQILEEKNLALCLAMDSSNQALKWLLERMPKREPTTFLNQADVHSLPFADHSFDVVLVESVLIFCDIEVALREIHRALKPGAFLLLNETLALNPEIIPYVPRLREIARFPSLSPFTQADWENTFAKTGFEIHWQRIEALNRLKFLMLLQMIGLPELFDGTDLVGYGLWALRKS